MCFTWRRVYIWLQAAKSLGVLHGWVCAWVGLNWDAGKAENVTLGSGLAMQLKGFAISQEI